MPSAGANSMPPAEGTPTRLRSLQIILGPIEAERTAHGVYLLHWSIIYILTCPTSAYQNTRCTLNTEHDLYLDLMMRCLTDWIYDGVDERKKVPEDAATGRAQRTR